MSALPQVVDIRTCSDVTPDTFTIVDICDGPGLLPHSVLFDDLDVFEQCRVLDAWYRDNWDEIQEIQF